MANDTRGFVYRRSAVPETEVQTLFTPGLKWAQVSSLERSEFCRWSADLPVLWPQGRAFGRNREVRWQRQSDGLYNVMVLTEETEYRPTGTGWTQVAPDIDGSLERQLLLWGELTRNSESSLEWIELRIPQALHYPVEVDRNSGLHVVISARDYTVGGIPVMTRWYNLKQKPKESGK